MSGPKRQCPDPDHHLPPKRQRATANLSSSFLPADANPVPPELISNQATPTPRIAVLREALDVPRAAQVEATPAISAVRAALGGLRDSLSELPLLRVALGDLLECIIDSEVEGHNLHAYDELASDLTNLAAMLQKHAGDLKPHSGPYSINNIVRVIDEQTALIRAQQGRSQSGRLATAGEDVETVLKCCRRVGALCQQLQTDILLSLRDELKERDMDNNMKDLCPVYDAYHNAALPTSATKRVGCTQGTRMGLLDTTLDWTRDGGAIKIFWLNGMAGTGKTTIAYTLCEMLQRDKLLGASFFCSRNSADCGDVNRIVPTIAYQLGQYSNLYRLELLKALKNCSDTSKLNISTQFKHLISEPFKQINEAIPKDVVVLIDALDECSDEAGTRTVLDLLIRHAADLPLKFFIASRPEPTISDCMEARTGALRSILWLHDIEESLVKADIKLYLTEALASMNLSPSEMDLLVAKAGKLFIFAATAARYIRPDRGAVNHRKRLLEVLELQPNPENLRHRAIDTLYSTVLSNAFNEEMYTKAELATRRQVLWTVICAKEPLTIPALAELLGVMDEDIRPVILLLQSVLHQSESTSVVSALHASFPDFLLTKERARHFHCDQVHHNSDLAAYCFKLMARSLRFNICALESSYMFDRDVPNLQTRADEAISTGLFYSCRYWGDHLTKGPSSPTLLSLLDSLLQRHLLFWMEVLHLKQQISHGGHALSQALIWLPTENQWSKLRDFISDACHFLTSFASNPTSLSTPHIYISVLPFTSKESRVRTTYWPRTRGLIEIEGAATEGGGRSVLATWDVGSAVRSIAQSSDGRRVVSGSNNDEVSVWDVSSGVRTLGPLKDHERAVCSVAFSPDNSRIASGSLDHTIRVWDAHNGDLVVGPLRGHTSSVSVAFSPDGTRLASGSSDRTIRMWDAYTGAAIGDAYQGHQDAVWSVAFSPDGEHLASGLRDHTIRVWNWRTGVADLGPMPGHAAGVVSVAYSSDGSRLASGSGDSTVRVWDMSSGTLLAGPFQGHTNTISSVSFSPNDAQIVSGSNDGTIRVWEVESGNQLAGLSDGHGYPITAVLFTTDGTRILSGSYDGKIRVWDARRRTTGATESLGHSSGIRSVATSPDGKHAASGSVDSTICVWDTHSGALVAGPFTGHVGAVNSVTFSPDGARIVSGSDDRTLRTWDASTGALLVGPFEGHTERVWSVAFSPNGSQIASGSGDNTVRLWNSHTGESVAEPFSGHIDWVYSIAFSPDGTRVVSGSYDKTVRMWGANNGTALWTSNAHTAYVYCVAFSPDGTRIVSGSGGVLVMDAADGAVLHGPFTGHTNWVYSVAFSPDGARVVSGSGDRTVHVSDVRSGAVVAGPLKGHTKGVTSVVFSPDGARIISGSWDNTIRFWDVAATTQPDASSFDGWSIDDDGWLISSQSQRLFWVPPDVRDGFWFPTPSNPLASNARSTTRVDHTTLLGDRWHGCYDASLG